MDRMSPLDAGFLHLEDRHTSLHIAGIGIFEGPPPAYTDVAELFHHKLQRVPRYRQRAHPVPLRLGRAVWVDDPHFDLGYHLRHTALPRPGDDAQLRRLVGRLMSQQLDRDRPLWEAWVVEGLEQDRWALISKVHHSMVDGIAGTDLISAIYDHSPGPTRTPPDAWVPERQPNALQLLTGAALERARSPLDEARSLATALRDPVRFAGLAAATVRGLTGYATAMRPTEASSLVGPIGPHRRYRWANVSLSDLQLVRQSFGGTLNDVVLALVTRGFRDLLIARGEPLNRHVVRSLVPVSVRHPSDRGRFDNRVSAMLAELPVDVDDPVGRLAEVATQMRHLKESREAVAGDALTSLAVWAPEPILGMALHVGFRLPHRNLTTVTTNVPGPTEPLYVAGRRMLATYPYVPIADRLRTGVAITSYEGQLTFGVTADRDTVPDVDLISTGIEAAATELVDAAHRHQASTRRRKVAARA